MAPSQPSRSLKSILKKKSSDSASRDSNAASESLFSSSKKDKRRIKHAQLMHKITKSSTTKPRRRRPNKKLITTLDALADALPDDDDETSGTATAGSRPQDQINVIKRKSLKSKPGAMKRREKLDKSERDRFAKNMAQLTPASTKDAGGVNNNNATSSTQPASQSAPSTSQRWAALRSFISQTLETKAELAALKT
ncbi:hypothetical protein LTR84_000064 [Exophiala bonariae]|uniref:Ribosome biogenesis protein SLX9 n=1 Tax=Exophiala bonariae TaxID=1690606 RepID=A0AAV9NQK1_9EURO|nr:hypothetical protein LTR84_000064 [Exophiala bonariae]